MRGVTLILMLAACGGIAGDTEETPAPILDATMLVGANTPAPADDSAFEALVQDAIAKAQESDVFIAVGPLNSPRGIFLSKAVEITWKRVNYFVLDKTGQAVCCFCLRLRQSSVDGVEGFQDGSVSFVLVEDTSGVAPWIPKLRPGGILVGEGRVYTAPAFSAAISR